MSTTFLFTFLTFTLFLQQSYSHGSHGGSSHGAPCTPEQIHLSLSDSFTSNPTSNNTIRAIFHTKEECKSAYISLTTPQGKVLKITATAVNFFQEACPEGNYSTYVHIFDFPNLEFSQIYQYSCYGSDHHNFLPNYEGPFKFYVPTPYNTNSETKVVMFADMDASPDGIITVNRLIDIAQNNFTNISAFIHTGDMAYNLQRDAGRKGDEYMRAIQPFTAIMPYMVTAGNHEDYGNFSNFNARFQMPKYEESQNHYYSFNIGNIHFTSFNLDLVLTYPESKQAMLEWLEKDLFEANNNREEQPWIIIFTHRPFYCSHPDDEDCIENHKRFADFEDVLIKYNVDLVHVGHVHFYERMLPIKKDQIAHFQHFPHDKDFHYIVNPEGPVHVLQGMAGHRGDLADPKEVYRGSEFTVMVSKAYSYMAVSSQNSTHLLVENFKSEKNHMNDYFYIVKSEEEEYKKLPVYRK